MADQIQIETLTAVMNPKQIIEGTATLGIGQLREAAAMVKRMRKRVLRFMSSDTFPGSGAGYETDDYEELLDLLSRTQEIPADKLNAVVPDNQLAMDIGIQAKKIKDWGFAAMPKDDEETLLGSASTSPPALSVADFMALWRVACDPMTAIFDLEDGMLYEEEVQTFAMLYPAFYGEVRQAISDAYAHVKAQKSKTWDPDPTKEILLRTMLQSNPYDPGLASALNKPAQQQQQQSAPSRKRSSTPEDSTNDTEITPGQKAAAA